MNDSIEIIFDGAIGDTICISAVCQEIKDIYGKTCILYTNFPDFFQNNPNVIESNHLSKILKAPNIYPCRVFSCNIINHYFKQVGLSYRSNIKPKIYLSDEEIFNAKKLLSKYDGNKKIAVCLNSSADIRDIRYSKILPLLNELKKDGYILLSISKYSSIKYYKFNSLVEDVDSVFHENFNLLGLREISAVINECSCYLGVDTGLFHISAALNIPQVVFFPKNGCSNNAYSNTYYLNSMTECNDACLIAPLAICQSENRCMDNFDFNSYVKLLKNII